MRGTLYAGAAALVVGASFLGPRHEAIAQPSAAVVSPSGVVVPASRTGQAILVPPRHVVVNGHAQGKAVNPPLLTLDSAALQKAKKAANDRAAAAVRSVSPATSHRPYDVYNGNNFPGLSTTGNSTPSDSTSSVGPGHYVEMVNSIIGVRPIPGPGSFTTAGLAPFGALNSTDCAFDPQISWDQVAGRWLYAFDDQVPATNCGNISTNYVAFGWSKTSDPSDLNNGWCRFVFGTGSYFFDYPKLGHDNNFINIGANVFAAQAFQTAVIISISMPAHGSTACTLPAQLVVFGSPTAHLKNADGTDAFTPVPAVTTDSYTAGYVVAAHYAGGGQQTKIMVWHVSSNAGTPVLTADGDMTVNSYGVPPAIPQPVTGATSCSTAGNCLDSLDGRLTQAVAHFDPKWGETVWTQHAVTDVTGPRSVERWYELAGTTLRQQGDVSDPALHIWNGAISPSLAGSEAVMFYNAGNSTAGGFASFRAQSRNSLMTGGTMANEVVLASSTVNDNDFSCGQNRMPPTGAPCRWGDYSAARPDPADQNVVWGTNMLTGTGGSLTASGWATQFAAYTPGCSVTTLSPKGANAMHGAIVRFTAVATTGCLNPEYQFWLQYPAGTGSYVIVQKFSGTATWDFDTATHPLGNYKIVVWGNQTGDSTASWESVDFTNFTILASTPCSTATLTPTSQTVPAGTPENFSATATPCPNQVFQFWLQYPAGTGPWVIEQKFSSGLSTWAWNTTRLVPGNYKVVVWANQRGDSTANFEAVASSTITLTGCGPVSVAWNPQSPQVSGTNPITLTATPTGCANPQFQFWMLAPNSSSWKIVQAYGNANNNIFSWNTSGMPAGTYSFSVWVKDLNSGGANGNSLGRWDNSANTTYILSVSKCTSVTVTSSPPNTTTVGTTVTFTAIAVGCQFPLYEFWMLAPGSSIWMDVQAYGNANGNVFTWTTTALAKGPYKFSVWARGSGSPGNFDASFNLTYTLT